MSKLKISASPQSTALKLLAEPRLLNAFQHIDELSEEILREHLRICEIPAPIFAESERAEYFRRQFSELGLADVHIDEAGNVIGCWPAPADEYICLSAHLDTVFPAGTDCRVQQQGQRYFAPGISDNAAGLIGMLAIARVMVAAKLRPEAPILFVGTVGEEGIGNLCGVRHIFTKSRYRDQIRYFISFDGPGIERITHRALGSKRYQVTLKGPGGHSWGDFGIVNPVHAIGRVIAKMASFQPPQQPRTTFNIGIIEGGCSVNTIPQEAKMQIDLRSVSESHLTKLEAFLMKAIQEAVSEENRLGAQLDTSLETEIEMIGHRPSGELPVASTLVQSAIEATKAFGISPYLECSSTDANIPISLGIEAITIGAGGSCGSCHTLDEWYENNGREMSLKRSLLLLMMLAGMDS